jgi:hypothetical protein
MSRLVRFKLVAFAFQTRRPAAGSLAYGNTAHKAVHLSEVSPMLGRICRGRAGVRRWLRVPWVARVLRKPPAKMTAKILSWLRSRGGLAGISAGGATLRNDRACEPSLRCRPSH